MRFHHHHHHIRIRPHIHPIRMHHHCYHPVGGGSLGLVILLVFLGIFGFWALLFVGLMFMF